jgi:hypothetical protein
VKDCQISNLVLALEEAESEGKTRRRATVRTNCGALGLFNDKGLDQEGGRVA